MDRKQFEEKILKPIKERGIVMSRVPERTRNEFIEFAENEFCDDRGMCFKWLFTQAMEYQKMKKVLFNIKLIKEFCEQNEKKDM